MARAPLALALAAAWLLAAWLPSAAGARVRATPVTKAIQMLNGMKLKAEMAMSSEQKVFAQYSEWVDDRSKDLNFEIKTSESNIDKLTALIEKADTKVSSLEKAISALESDINRLEQEKKDATTVRDSEQGEYAQLQRDYSDSVDALERAIETISSQAYNRPQAEQLLQRMAEKTPGMGRVLVAFVQHGAEDTGAPAASAYEFQSDGIVQFLQELLTKFKSELDSTEEAEANRAHYYKLQMVHLSDTIAQSSADLKERTASKTNTAVASAKAKGDLTEAKRELAGDKTLLEDLTATFQVKQRAYAANQQVRKDELEALGKALEILSSPSVADSYGQHISLVQAAAASRPSLLQMGSSQRRLAARRRAEELLRRRAGEISSRTLQSLLAQMASNPFAKVVTMIEDLLARLKQEAGAEAEHKAWCDEQLKSNKLKREKQSTKVDELSAELEELGVQIKNAGKAVQVLVQEQAELTRAMGEATEQRETEKKANAEAIADAKAGAAAVKQALVVLKEFYTAQSASLLQQGTSQVPELAAYTGMQGKGAMGMLEVIESDFVRLQARTEAAEQQAVTEYDQFMSDAQADQKLKHDEEAKLRLQQDADEFAKSEKKKDLAVNQEGLNTANSYYEDLKPTCLEVHVSYEDRAQRRQEELAALKEAYGILQSKATV